MADTSDMVLPLLREMRTEMSAFRAETGEPLNKVEGSLESFRHALRADSLLSKMVTGGFEERIEALELKVRELEQRT